jgi:hypothetical protein
MASRGKQVQARLAQVCACAVVLAGSITILGGAPAHAADPPAPPTMTDAVSGSPGATGPDAAGAFATVTGTPGDEVHVQFASSSGDVCSKAMEGPDVTLLPPVEVTIPADGSLRGAKSYGPLIAGHWAYATATVDGVTSAVSNCVRVGTNFPRNIHLVSVTRTTATFDWDDTAGADSYDITVNTRAGAVSFHEMVGPDSSVTVTGLQPGGVYGVLIVGYDDDAGQGNGGFYGRHLVPPFGSHLELIRQQYGDYFGRLPTRAERDAWTQSINTGLTTSRQIDAVVDNPYWGGAQAPVIRLMRAYFQRIPDRTGLNYWTNKRRAGSSIRAISTAFAQSDEFHRKYGSLTNAAFVDRVYRNVLGRAPDSGGLAYWTKQLDRHRTSRGGVMASFSESDENVRTTKPWVDAIDVYTAMLRRVPTTTELATWAPTSGTPPRRIDVIFSIISSSAYEARLPGPA